MEGINSKRIIFCLIIAAITAIICAVGTVLFNPGVSMIYLFHIVYLRLVLGLVIGLIPAVELIDNEMINSIVRGAIMGILLSIPLLMVPVPTVINYLVAGTIFGVIIDFVATKFA